MTCTVPPSYQPWTSAARSIKCMHHSERVQREEKLDDVDNGTCGGPNGTQKHFNTRTARHDMTVPTTYQRWTSATGTMASVDYS